MISYFDSSSIVKWFFDEKFSDTAREIRDSSEIVVTSLIAFPEVMSAFNRAWQERRCTRSDLKVVQSEFLRVWPNMQWITINEMLVRRAGELIFRYDLKGFDSIHLASALILKTEIDQVELFFSCFDTKLNVTAQKEGFATHKL